MRDRVSFWWRWLIVVTVGMALFGISMIIAPSMTRMLFGLLVFSSADRIATFGDQAVAYISLTHAIVGAVMLGWAMALLLILLGPFRRGDPEALRIFVISLLCWFVPDTSYSLWSGFWQNAALNLTVVILFAVPLAAIYRANHVVRDS